VREDDKFIHLEDRRMRIVKEVVLALCITLLYALISPGARADSSNKKTIVTFSDSVEIPGQVLPAGTYVFKLVESSNDRHIVQVWNGNETRVLATILAVPNYRAEPADKSIFEFDERSGESPMALQSWFYPGDSVGQEFVYSHNR